MKDEQLLNVTLTEEEQDWFLCNGYGSNAGPNQVRHLVQQLERIRPLLARAGLHIVTEAEKHALDAAEAKLAAVREEFTKLQTHHHRAVGHHYIAGDVNRIYHMLAPSQGEGGGGND
jgi:hypothetical protein